MAHTPVFHAHGFLPAHGVQSVRGVALIAMAFVSLLLTGLLIALVFLTDTTPLWVVPVGVAVLWKIGLFAWAADLRTGLALRRNPVSRAAARHSVDHVRGWLRDSLFPTTVEALKMDTMDLLVHWGWTPKGLEATSFVVRGGPGKTLAITLSDRGVVPTVAWDDPALRDLLPHKQALLEGRWQEDMVVATTGLPVGSAHARLALVAWASDPSHSDKVLA